MGVLASALGRRHPYNSWDRGCIVGWRLGRLFVELRGGELDCAVVAIDNGTDSIAEIAQQMPAI